MVQSKFQTIVEFSNNQNNERDVFQTSWLMAQQVNQVVDTVYSRFIFDSNALTEEEAVSAFNANGFCKGLVITVAVREHDALRTMPVVRRIIWHTAEITKTKIFDVVTERVL